MDLKEYNFAHVSILFKNNTIPEVVLHMNGHVDKTNIVDLLSMDEFLDVLDTIKPRNYENVSENKLLCVYVRNYVYIGDNYYDASFFNIALQAKDEELDIMIDAGSVRNDSEYLFMLDYSSVDHRNY